MTEAVFPRLRALARLTIRREKILLLGIVGIALMLRLIALHSRGIEYDDAFSVFLARQTFSQIVSGTAADTMPPLYYFLLHIWMALGDQVWVLRLLNVVLSLAVMLVAFQLGRKLLGARAGLWMALITALSPLQIFHAQGMRMYVLLTLATLSYTWFFAALWLRAAPEQPTGRWLWAGVVLSGAIAMYSHNLAVFTLVVPDILLVLRREWRLLARLLIAQIMIGLLALPWLILVPDQISKVQAAFWTPKPGLVQVLQAVVTFHTNLPVPDLFMPIALILSVQVMVFVGIETVRKIRADQGVMLLAAFAMIPPILLFVISYLMRPVFVPRVFILSSIAYYGLLASALVKTRVPTVAYLIVAASLVGMVLVLPAQYGDHSFPRSPFGAATAYLERSMDEGDVIVHDNKLSFFPAHYYAPDLPQKFLADPAGTHNDTLAPATQDALGLYPEQDLRTAVHGAARVWFIVFDTALKEYDAQGFDQHPVMASLDMDYDLLQQETFNDLHVFLYAH